MTPHLLETPITYLKGVGPRRAEVLQKELEIFTYQDLLYHFPNRYIDRTQYAKIQQLQQSDTYVQLVGRLISLKTIGTDRKKRLVGRFADETGTIELLWFKGQAWQLENLVPNTYYVVYGRINFFNGFNIVHPEVELLDQHQTKLQPGLKPVYPTTEKINKAGITNRVMNKIMHHLIFGISISLPETLSQNIQSDLQLVSINEALRDMHFPKNQIDLRKAKYRLKFEELFFIQLQLLNNKRLRKQRIKGFCFEKVGDYFHTFYGKHLPFDLTAAQKRVIKEIRKDLGSQAQMNRLLQGDVGSGKTIVAFLSMLLALDNQYQACMVAPTAVLAEQHYQSVVKLAHYQSLRVALLTGSTKAKKRNEILKNLQSGSIQILIGTHAVFEDRVQFDNLGLAIIDEQHRFGVAQRSKLWQKNKRPPHILVMTATPIPRTLAMSVYGDLDISVIDELPSGRKSVQTMHRYDSHRLSVFRLLAEEIQKGRQVYVVYPLIEESEAMDYKDLMDGYASISRAFPKPEYQISVVHGQMKAADKALEMQRFVAGQTHIMIATTVIEVGVNVPNATVMLIESAERFGLSQLHQLRGRVGRGSDQSYCILMTGYKLSADGKTRLQTMTQTNDGFALAEVDLKLRGPGDLLGTQQSGVLQLKVADLVQDQEILKIARQYASKLIQEDPKLLLDQNKQIAEAFRRLTRQKSIWRYIS